MPNDTYTQVGQLVNTVRNLAGDIYQSIVPVFKHEADADINAEFQAYSKMILENTIAQNKFLNVFQDIILYEAFEQHIFENEFSSRFKRASDPVRRASFETFVNPIIPLQYDGEALERILHLYKRDVKKQVFVRNREDLFPVSINPEELQSAFQSMEAFMDFYRRQYRDLADSNAIVEYNLIKQVFNLNYASGALKSINVHGMSAKEKNKLLKSLIGKMSKPSSAYNNYINIEGATGAPVITHTPKESLLFVPSSDLLAELDTEVLASAYNLPYAKVTENIIDVDDFGYDVYDRQNQTITGHENSKIVGILCDENILKFTENLKKQFEAINGATMTNQTFIHVWQTIALRSWCNCIVLIDDGEEPTPPSDTFKITDETVTIENGSAVLHYEGNFPAGENNEEKIASIIPTYPIEGVKCENVFYNVTVNAEDKTITINVTDENTDGIINGTVMSFLSLGVGAQLVYVTGLPIIDIPCRYETKVTGVGSFGTVSVGDSSISAELIGVPDDVTPEAEFELSAELLSSIIIMNSTMTDINSCTGTISNNILTIDTSSVTFEAEGHYSCIIPVDETGLTVVKSFEVSA